jgi:peptidyl-prolyl cis-trans isomerase D
LNADATAKGRQMAKSKGRQVGLWIIMGLLFVGLVGFGSAGLTGNVRSLGTAGDKDIAIQSYANALRRQIDAFSQQIGSPLSFQQAQAIGLDQQVLAGIVTTRVLDNEVARIGLSAGDLRIRDEILSLDAFTGLDGTFDRALYADQLSRNGMTEAEFETGLREDLARTLLQGAVLGAIASPDAYAQTIAAWLGERRALTWASLGPEALTTPLPAPTDADLQAHYDANPDAFTDPEQRQITYAWVTPSMIEGTVTVDEQDVRDLYDSRIDEYVQPERRLTERLVFGTEEEAQAARARLDAGEITFDALVTERGLTLADIDLGDASLADLGPAGEAVFAAGPDTVVGPFMSDLGPALFRMNAILDAQEITFDEAAPDLRGELANQRARRMISEMTEGFADLVAGGATIEDLADRTEMELGTITWSEDVSDGIAAYGPFRSAAALATVGAFPELVDLDDGGVFVLRLDEIVPPALIPFDEVRAEVEDGWRTAATAAAILARAEEAATAIAGGASFEDQTLVPTIEEGLTRRDFLAGTPPDFLTRVFALAPGETAFLPNGDGAIVVRLDAILPADMADPAVAAETEMIAAQTRAGIAEDLFGAYADALQSRTEVLIDQTALNAVNSQFQ